MGGRTAKIRYLSRADVEALAPSGAELADCIEATLQGAAAGCAQNFPKTSKICPDGRLFQSIMAVGTCAPAPLYAATKVVGLSPANAARGLPHIGGIIVLNHGETGMPVAIMDATWVTEFRTAALSLVAARRYARSASRSIGFIGCGAQARAHLQIFVKAFPIATVTAFSRSFSSAAALAETARVMGLEATPTTDALQAVFDQDIVISSVPGGAEFEPFLSGDWLSAGVFASLVDLGRSWRADSFGSIEHRLVDDRTQAEASRAYRKLTPDGPYTADLIEMANDPGLRRQSEADRAVFTFQGLALADLAVASLVFTRAEKANAGLLLPA